MSTLISLGIGLAVAVAIFYGGILYERRENLAAQNQQLKNDANVVTEIEVKDDGRKAKVVEIIKVVKESPQSIDWFNQPMPDTALHGLHDAGIRTRPETNR